MSVSPPLRLPALLRASCLAVSQPLSLFLFAPFLLSRAFVTRPVEQAGGARQRGVRCGSADASVARLRLPGQRACFASCLGDRERSWCVSTRAKVGERWGKKAGWLASPYLFIYFAPRFFPPLLLPSGDSLAGGLSISQPHAQRPRLLLAAATLWRQSNSLGGWFHRCGHRSTSPFRRGHTRLSSFSFSSIFVYLVPPPLLLSVLSSRFISPPLFR